MNLRELNVTEGGYPLRLLLVSDDMQVASVLTDFLNGEGVEVALFSLDEFDCVGVKRFDFVIFHADTMAGYESITAFLTQWPQCPVVLYTHNFEVGVVDRLMQAGLSDCLREPMRLDFLGLKIQRLVFDYRQRTQAKLQYRELRRLAEESDDNERLAESVYQDVIASHSEPLRFVIPVVIGSEKFSGDLVLSGEAPNGKSYVLLADATGHGLAAAISLMPVASVFKAMVRKGSPLDELVYEINYKLFHSHLVGRYVACCIIELSPFDGGQLKVWNGGLPEVLVCDDKGHVQQRFPSQHMALGILDESEISVACAECALKPNQHIFIYSDGLTELKDTDNALLTNAIIPVLVDVPDDDLWDTLQELIEGHTGNVKPHDDLSVVRICTDALLAYWASMQSQNCRDEAAGQLNSEINLIGACIANAGIRSSIDSILSNTRVPKLIRLRAYTVFVELYNNAVDHGVLNLPSNLKETPEGFSHYLSERMHRIDALSEDAMLDINLQVDVRQQLIRMRLKDCGQGYNSSSLGSSSDAHGRGLKLVHELCESVEITPPGNDIQVIIKWEEHE